MGDGLHVVDHTGRDFLIAWKYIAAIERKIRKDAGGSTVEYLVIWIAIGYGERVVVDDPEWVGTVDLLLNTLA